MIDTIYGVTSSAIIYSIVETTKVNNLKPYDYFKYLLAELPKHEQYTDFLKELVALVRTLLGHIRKSVKEDAKNKLVTKIDQ